jgi:hypothetical protein
MQRAWLALTEQGLSAQPMMSLAVLEGAFEHGAISPSRSAHRRLQGHLNSVKSIAGMPAASRLAFLLRFGWAEPPSGRTGRLAIDDVLMA